MAELIHAHFAYWLCFLVLTIGLYGMLVKRNLVKKLIGLTIFQTAIILFFIVAAFREGGTVPVVDPNPLLVAAPEVTAYINPLPHTLMLTAIVVGVATLGVAFALLIRVHQGFGTLDEGELRERMRQ